MANVLGYHVVYVLCVLFIQGMEAVEFLLHPKDTSGVQGTTITLHCGTNNEFQIGHHKIYWAFYQTPGQPNFLSVDHSVYSSLAPSKRERYSIVGVNGLHTMEFNLRIKNAQLEDIGGYECILYDPSSGQRISTPDLPARVVVLALRPPDVGWPRCSITPSRPTPGTLATFTCMTKGGLPRPNLTWMKQNAALPSVLNSTDLGYEILQFKRYITPYDNNSTFTCTVQSSALKEARNCSVTPFEVPITVTVTPLQTVKVGNSAAFFCSASGVPAVNRYRWFVGRGADAEKVTSSVGRYTLSTQGTYLIVKDITEMDNGLAVKCVARNALDLRGTDEGIIRVPGAKPRPTTGTTGGLFTTPRKDNDPTKNGGFGNPNKHPSSGSFGMITLPPVHDVTVKQRVFDGPMVTYHMNNGLGNMPHSSRFNIAHLVSGASGLFLVILTVFIILLVIVRRSNSGHSGKKHLAKVKSARRSRPNSTGTLTKSDIVVLPTPCFEDEEQDLASRPVGAEGMTIVKLISLEKAATLDKTKTNSLDFMSQLKGTLRGRQQNYTNFYENEALTKSHDMSRDNISDDFIEGGIVRCDSAFCDDFKPGRSGSETALNEYWSEPKFPKCTKADLSKSTGNLVYVELDFSQVKQSDAVQGGNDKTHYAEIRMSRNIEL